MNLMAFKTFWSTAMFLEVTVSDRCSLPAKQQLEPQKQDSELLVKGLYERRRKLCELLQLGE